MKFICATLGIIFLFFSFLIFYIVAKNEFQMTGLVLGIATGITSLFFLNKCFLRKKTKNEMPVPTKKLMPSIFLIKVDSASGILFASSFGFYTFAIEAYFSNSIEKSKSRHAFINNFFLENFGQAGLVLFWLVLGTFLLLLACKKMKQINREEK